VKLIDNRESSHLLNWTALRFFLILAVFILPGSAAWAQQSESTSDCTSDCEDETSTLWLDRSHTYVSNKADDMAQWMDRFFGVRRAELEAANSTLRLQLGYNWDEQESSTDIRLRGKLYLPRISERVSLVFNDEDQANLEAGSLDQIVRNQDDSNSVALEYNLTDHPERRLDIRLGLRDIYKLKTGLRYRYLDPYGDNTLGRYIEELYFIDGEGFGSLTRLEFDHLLSPYRLVRWSNRFRFSEDTHGVDWGTKLSLNTRAGEKTAVSYYAFYNGETRPQLITDYGLGLNYRQNFFRQWLFYEVEPTYSWRRESVEVNREGVLGIALRLELVLEADL